MKLKNDGFIEDLNRWISAYLSHILALSYSNNTFLLYKRVLEQFIEYSLDYQDEMQINEIKSSYIVNFLNFLEKNAKNAENLSKKTKMTYLRTILSFFNFISENNDDFFNFSFNLSNSKIRSSKTEEKLEYLNEDEIKRLICVLERKKDKNENFESYRNAFLIKLMLYAGLRISECLKIRLCDFEYEDENLMRIKILAKGGKEQFAYIQREQIDEELEYFQKSINTTALIFQTKHNKPLNRSNAFSIVVNSI